MFLEKFRPAIWRAEYPASPTASRDNRMNRRLLRSSGSRQENKSRRVPQLSFQRFPWGSRFDVEDPVLSLLEIGARCQLNQSRPQILFCSKLTKLQSQSRRKGDFRWFLAGKSGYAREIAWLNFTKDWHCRVNLQRIAAGVLLISCKMRLEVAVAHIRQLEGFRIVGFSQNQVRPCLQMSELT